ncbi:MAG: hypothetical protein HC853_11900 [Anaerolineae bacterium]|nr:hypothetical protein [Anaerolineae bacterium]
MFKAKGVTGEQQIYVDFQIRPKNGEHLAWQNSVLDWPANDTEGQIQTYTQTLTIADATRMTAAQIANDPAATRGNLRMTPMLEINLGSNPPIKRTSPKADLTVRNSDNSISGTLSFNRTGDATTSMAFSFAQPSGFVSIGLYDNSSCTSVNFGGELHRYSGVSSGAANSIGQATLTLLQGQRVAVISATVGSEVKQACVALPDLPNGNDPQTMADTSWLSSYGVSISDLGNAQKEMLAYVPLNVTYNAKGTRREAWSARMPYWQTGNDWGIHNESTSCGCCNYLASPTLAHR